MFSADCPTWFCLHIDSKSGSPYLSSGRSAHIFPDKNSHTIAVICEVHLLDRIDISCLPSILLLMTVCMACMGRGRAAGGGKAESWQETQSRISLTFALVIST